MGDHTYYKQNRQLIQAANNGEITRLNTLIKAGADVNSRSRLGKTPCMLAAGNGHRHCLQALIKAGANVNNWIGVTTALGLAWEANKTDCVKILIEAGADISKEGIHTFAVFEFAVKKGLNTCIKSIAKAGVDVNLANNRKTALIMLAEDIDNTDAGTSLIPTAMLLLKLGAHVNKVNHFGNNALRCHIRNGRGLNKRLAMSLFAAGEKIHDTPVSSLRLYGFYIIEKYPVPEFLLNNDLKLCLKHLCREAIRKHLIDLDPHENLFNRIPKLGLPSLVNEYLLYDVSLDLKKT